MIIQAHKIALIVNTNPPKKREARIAIPNIVPIPKSNHLRYTKVNNP